LSFGSWRSGYNLAPAKFVAAVGQVLAAEDAEREDPLRRQVRHKARVEPLA
jgi:hypothetical protein